MIREADRYSLRCVTDDDLIYIFTDQHYGGIFDWNECDVTDPEIFFEEVFSRYDDVILEDFFYGVVPW